MIAPRLKTPSLEDAEHAAMLHHRQGQLDKAEELYREILSQQPDRLVALNNFARVLQDQNKFDEALGMFQRVTTLRPDMALAYNNLGVVLCQLGKLEESFAAFRRHAELAYGSGQTWGKGPAQKAQHDEEQRDYLKSQNLGDKNFYIAEASRNSGPAVNPDASNDAIATHWQNNQPQIVVIDNFLSAEALQKLQQYCLASTIWQQPYAAGYLGAMHEHGIGSPLLAQIAEELRTTYPAIAGPYPLRQFWAFKYASGLDGVAVHADFAAVNVNFWITPDDANQDLDSGGLIIWDKPAPHDWDFSKYNDDVSSTREFLKQSGAKPVTVPYRCNRAVIFDSRLFHETDRIDFKPGYANRRVNITLLYGGKEIS